MSGADINQVHQFPKTGHHLQTNIGLLIMSFSLIYIMLVYKGQPYMIFNMSFVQCLRFIIGYRNLTCIQFLMPRNSRWCFILRYDSFTLNIFISTMHNYYFDCVFMQSNKHACHSNKCYIYVSEQEYVFCLYFS